MAMLDYTTAVVVDATGRVIQNQSAYRKYANTVNATLAALAGVLTALSGQWAITGEFPKAQAVLLVVAPMLTALVTYLTKNGVSPSVQRELVSEAQRMEAQSLMERRAVEAAQQVQGRVNDAVGQGTSTLELLRRSIEENRR